MQNRERPERQFKTTSERAFASYLSAQSISHEYEPASSGPDFLIRHEGQKILCEVTERRRRRLSEAIEVIRNKIRGKVSQGRQTKGTHPYVVVLQFVDQQNADLDATLFPEAMFGTAQATWRLDDNAGNIDVGLSFGPGGRLQPRMNTRVSAVASLQEINPGLPDFLALCHATWNQRSPGSDDGPEAFMALAKGLERDAISRGEFDPQLTLPRLLVFHNPHAEIPLGENLFVGPYDAQWNLREGRYCLAERGPGAASYDEALQRWEEAKAGRHAG